MRVRHFVAGCLAGLSFGNWVTESIAACDRCRGVQICNSCGPTDDRGLLDHIDSLLQRRQPKLPPLTAATRPVFQGALRCAVAGGCHCQNGSDPGCGCELSEPTCGCELTEANCGVEISLHRGYIHEHDCPLHSHLESTLETEPASPVDAYRSPLPKSNIPQPIPPSLPTGEESLDGYVAPDIVPYKAHSPNTLEPVRPSVKVPELAPTLQKREDEPTPPHDTEVDPFQDESAGRLRRIPTRQVQHSQSQRVYRESYDPQARRAPVHRTINDDGISSRQVRNNAPIKASQPGRERSPEVVTASGNEAQELGKSSVPESYKNASQGAVKRIAAEPITNPLRGSRR